ncbi:MAG: peptidoglycan-binding protein [Pseudomonadota bacterium]
MAKLTLTRCVVEGGQTHETSGPGNVFKVTINPADYKHTYGVSYTGQQKDRKQPMGKSAVVAKFSAVNQEKVDFSVTLDGTGVVPGVKQSVADQVKAIRDIAYTYSGKEHEPNVVKLTWGRGLNAFFGRLTSMTVDYTLFHPAGQALRAKVTMSFVAFATQMEEALKAQRSSPDMTHVVEVKAGDTLPLLCQRIYRDASQYMHVATVNGLDGFRSLTPGTVLRFPPIR